MQRISQIAKATNLTHRQVHYLIKSKKILAPTNKDGVLPLSSFLYTDEEAQQVIQHINQLKANTPPATPKQESKNQ